MRRQKAGVVVSAILCACLLSACSITISSNSSSPSPASSESSSSEVSQSTADESSSSTSSSVSTATSDSNEAGSDSNFPVASSSTITSEDENPTESQSGTTSDEVGKNTSSDGLVKYTSIYDIPFADLDYERDRNALSLNGEPWISAPGPSKLGDLCFTDGKILIIQCFYGDYFVWFTASFDSDVEAPYLPEETENKLFTHAEGYTLYTDDGYQYTVENP